MSRPSKPALELRGRIWRYVFTVRGERFRGTTGESDRGRAQSVLALRWHEAHKAKAVPLVAGPGVGLDFAGVAGLWLADLEERAGEKNPQYVARHKLDTKYLKEHFQIPQDVSNQAWQAATRKLHEKGLSWASLRHATVTLRHLMHFSVSVGAIASAPELKPPPLKLANKEQAPRRALDATERDRVLKAMRQNGDDRAARIWLTMAYTGLRRGELAKLTLRWLDTAAGIIRIPATAAKSGEPETIPLHPKARQAIRAEAAAAGLEEKDEPVFGGFDIRKAWKRALRKSKVDKHGLTPHHSARHTYGTLVAQLAKGDVTAVQAAGRWRSLAMVARYVHADAARARAAVRRL